jgi:hypothetical protein
MVTKTSVWVWEVSWCELFSGKVCGCAWATVDEESGSSTVVFSKQLSYLGYKNDLRKPFRNEPLHE